jgi:tRNA threonylcarbamoyladenosine biosynthesis protein TsaE
VSGVVEPPGVSPDESIELTGTLPDPEATRAYGRALAGVLQAGDLVVLTGPLGAGKTTLVQGIGDGMAVRGQVASPTFIIARVHPPLGDGPALVHADAYRLGSLDELEALDLDTSLEESVTVVEWGEGLVEVLSADRLEVTLDRGHGGVAGQVAEGAAGEDVAVPRRLAVRGVGPRWAGVVLPGA